MKIEHKTVLGRMRLRQLWRGRTFVMLALLFSVTLFISCEAAPTNGTSSGSVSNAPDGTMRIEPDTSPNARNMTIDPLLPPGGSDRPAKSGQLGRARTENGLPVLDAKGPNLEQLFAQPEKNTDARIKRLENAVVEIRKDLDAALPAINRLMSIEGDIQELVTQLQTLLSEEGLNGNAPKMPALRPPSPPSETDKLIDELKDGAGGATIEPLNPNDLVKPVPQKMPIAGPADVETKTLEPLAPSQQNDTDGEDGVSVDPLPRDDVNTFSANKPVPDVVADQASAQKPADIKPLKAATTIPSPKAATEKVVKPPAKKAETAQAVQKISSPKIDMRSVRLGDHGDMVRVVIESEQPIKITQDLDNTEKILVIDVKGAAMSDARQAVANNPLVSAMSIKGNADNKSGQVALELKKDTRVQMTTVMPPQGDKKVYRAVVDLAR